MRRAARRVARRGTRRGTRRGVGEDEEGSACSYFNEGVLTF